ncbi:hypothetical protein [Prescottella equi]|uniref:hypothetical protein n=1 Tax=Rhodococcus hoagii TaxID=43767 RepID=UPI0007CD46C3|nr:hypothetical protein [Prescottella equi]
MTHPIEQLITFTPDEIRVGGDRIPGVIVAETVTVHQVPGHDDAWVVSLTLMTTALPLLAPGVHLDARGRVQVDPDPGERQLPPDREYRWVVESDNAASLVTADRYRAEGWLRSLFDAGIEATLTPPSKWLRIEDTPDGVWLLDDDGEYCQRADIIGLDDPATTGPFRLATDCCPADDPAPDCPVHGIRCGTVAASSASVQQDSVRYRVADIVQDLSEQGIIPTLARMDCETIGRAVQDQLNPSAQHGTRP